MEYALSMAPSLFSEGFRGFDVEGEYLEKLERKVVREGEIALMLAVLEDAVQCYVKYAETTDRKGRQEFKEAQEWIFHRNSDWLFSFENICEVLGIDPGYLREGLRRWKENLARHDRETWKEGTGAAVPS